MLTKLKNTTIFKYLQQLLFRYKDDELTGMSAQITYYLILAFFPFLIFLINLLSFTNLSSGLLITSFNELIPNEIGNLMKNVVIQTLQNKSKTLLSIGMVGSLWATSQGVFAIMRGLNKAYDAKENRKFIRLNIVALISTIGLIAMIFLSLIMIVFGKILGTYLFNLVGAVGLFDVLWSILRYFIPSVLMFITFFIIYKFLPNKKLKSKNIRVGAFFATIGWVATSLVFSFYVNNFGHYEKVYGSLGGIIILIVWLYISTLVILIGGELNAISSYLEMSGKKGNDSRD